MNKLIGIISFIFLFLFGQTVGQKADLTILKAKAYLSQKKYNEVLQVLSQKQTLQSVETFKIKGLCFYETGNFINALTIYLKADSIRKNSCSYEIARCYAQMNQPKQSSNWLIQHLSGNNKRSEFDINTDKAFEIISATNEWKNIWKKEWYTPSEIEKTAINALIKHEKFTEAIDRIDKSRNIITPKSELNALEANIYIGIKQWNLALTSINEAIESNNRNDTYYAIKAEILMMKGDFKGAVDNLTHAIAINTNEPGYYIQRANAAILSENYALAQSDLALYGQLYPQAPETLFQLGKLEAAKGNNLNALDYYSQLLQIDESNPVYFIERAEVAYNSEKYELADHDLALALDLNPEMEKANLLKGKVRMYFMDIETACFYFEKAIKLGNAEALKIYNEKCRK
jgi:tetratricopeptide (TPR) repeat protein